MKYGSADYFSYKKNKIQTKTDNRQKAISKISFLIQLFLVTFIIIFITIVFFIMKLSSRVDIEYPYQDDTSKYNPTNTKKEQIEYIDEEIKGKIDKRLSFIQQEENAPSEARIIEKTDSRSQIIDPIHIENSKKIEKLEKYKNQNIKSEVKASNLLFQESKLQVKSPQYDSTLLDSENITITSKVLIGRFPSFEDAQKIQAELKELLPEYSPFIRKTGDVFSVQMGSYQDFSTAKAKAQILKAKGYDVWIYQQ